MENPTTRPDEGAERSARFGRQLGVLESFIFLHGFEYTLISPQLWKSRLNLPGKEKDPKSIRASEFFEELYPQHKHLIRGPRGGLLDGPLDALLIAESMRSGVLEGKYSRFVDYMKTLKS